MLRRATRRTKEVFLGGAVALCFAALYAETSFAEKAEKPRGRKARRTAAASKVSPSSRKVSLARRVARRSIRTFPALEPVFRRVQRAL